MSSKGLLPALAPSHVSAFIEIAKVLEVNVTEAILEACIIGCHAAMADTQVAAALHLGHAVKQMLVVRQAANGLRGERVQARALPPAVVPRRLVCSRQPRLVVRSSQCITGPSFPVARPVSAIWVGFTVHTDKHLHSGS